MSSPNPCPPTVLTFAYFCYLAEGDVYFGQPAAPVSIASNVTSGSLDLEGEDDDDDGVDDNEGQLLAL